MVNLSHNHSTKPYNEIHRPATRSLLIRLFWLLNLIEPSRTRRQVRNHEGSWMGKGGKTIKINIRRMMGWRSENKYPPNEHGNWQTRLRVLQSSVLSIGTSEVERYLCPSLNSKGDDILPSLHLPCPVSHPPPLFNLISSICENKEIWKCPTDINESTARP